jgi:hypothetical protein
MTTTGRATPTLIVGVQYGELRRTKFERISNAYYSAVH